MKCDLCGKEMATFTNILINGEALVVHPSCKNKRDVKADYDFERQKEGDENV